MDADTTMAAAATSLEFSESQARTNQQREENALGKSDSWSGGKFSFLGVD